MLGIKNKSNKTVIFNKPPLYPECRPCFTCNQNRKDIEYLLKKVQYLEQKLIDLENKNEKDISIRSLPKPDSNDEFINDFTQHMKSILSVDSFDNIE